MYQGYPAGTCVSVVILMWVQLTFYSLAQFILYLGVNYWIQYPQHTHYTSATSLWQSAHVLTEPNDIIFFYFLLLNISSSSLTPNIPLLSFSVLHASLVHHIVPLHLHFCKPLYKSCMYYMAGNKIIYKKTCWVIKNTWYYHRIPIYKYLLLNFSQNFQISKEIYN